MCVCECVCGCVCVCVCVLCVCVRARAGIFYIVILEPLLISTLCVSFFVKSLITFSISMYIILCYITLVRRFEPQGRFNKVSFLFVLLL